MIKIFKIKGMHCKSCETLIRDSLEEKGIKVLEISSIKGVLKVEINSEQAKQVSDCVKDAGYSLE